MALRQITLEDFLSYNLEWHPAMEDTTDQLHWAEDDEANITGATLFYSLWDSAISSLHEKMKQIAQQYKAKNVIYNSTLFNSRSDIIVTEINDETNKFFTRNALEEARLLENQLDLKDFNDIKTWLEKY